MAMFGHYLRRLLPVLLLLACTGTSCKKHERRPPLSLNGDWEITRTEITQKQPPATFDRTITVPGLVDEVYEHTDGYFWYRRVFHVRDRLPAAVLLKIHKAKYAKQVWLNGTLLPEHKPNFTPGYYDVRSLLKDRGRTNTLVVRLGGFRGEPYDDHGEGSPYTGFDQEKERYIPGIYDDVELILTGSPRIVRVQTAPDIRAERLRVVTVLRNETDRDFRGPVLFRVQPVDGGPVAGQTKELVEIPAGGSLEVDTDMTIADMKLWSPESPFLYELTTITPGHQEKTRFGMRTFRFDAESRRPVLNDQVYMMRGTNVCIYRFFEDEQRRRLPWDKEWVRALFRKFKSMNWNSARFCIGFPPEIWYEVADEEGFLIQDEFPIWWWASMNYPVESHLPWPEAATVETGIAEFTEWMHERMNHPSVVIWDALNETDTADNKGRGIIAAVRGLDLQDRPWNNGRMEPDREATDPYEAHPYTVLRGVYSADGLEGYSKNPLDTSTTPFRSTGPLIINEYAWWWVNRDGSPTTLTTGVYNFSGLGPDRKDAAVERRDHFCRMNALLTEFWRSGDHASVIQHFVGLSYSRPGSGETSDAFLDPVAELNFFPCFETRVKSAFAPVGIVVDAWAVTREPGPLTVEVVLLNDTNARWQNRVHMALLRDAGGLTETVEEEWRAADLGPIGRSREAFTLEIPETPGHYRMVASYTDGRGETVFSERQIRVWPPVSGTITDQGRPMAGVQVVAAGKKSRLVAATDSAGFYSFEDRASLTGAGPLTVAAGAEGMAFVPATRQTEYQGKAVRGISFARQYIYTGTYDSRQQGEEFDGLRGFTTVDGDLIIRDTALDNLRRLGGLYEITGDLIIAGNPALTGLGLSNLYRVDGRVTVTGNGFCQKDAAGVVDYFAGMGVAPDKIDVSGNKECAE